ncbi:MAG: elongation factor G [Magnetococcales bacterium]|nr:elongation factor G [Magnetococcales bacterium]
MTTSIDNRQIRNIALIAHGGGGKTTLAETLLFNAKAIAKRGAAERGTTVMSTEPEEVARHITTTPHVAHYTWRECLVNLVDTPGYIDFLEATRGVLSVVGGAVLMFSGESGVKPETERLASMIHDALVPTLGFINEMDKPRADFIRTLGEIEKVLGVTALPLTIPIGAGESFQGIVDLIPMTAWSAKDGVFTQIDLPASARDDAEHYRQQLVEKIVEADDALLEKFLEEEKSPPDDVLHQGIKEAVLTRRLLPVFCGSALANIGVRALANGVFYYMPNPRDKAIIKPIEGKNPEHDDRPERREPLSTDPFAAVVFKTAIDPYSGKLSVLRVFSGILEAEKEFYNGTRRVKEKGGRLFKLMGKEMQPVEQLSAGEIGAVAKLAHTQTGDTLCAIDQPIRFERVHYLEPPLAFAVEVDAKTEDKASTGLGRLAEEDPTLQFYRDKETNEMILAGMGQTHLAVVLDRLKRKFGANAILKTPRVPYRETVTRKVRVQGRLKKQTGGRGQFGDCWIEMEPLPRGTGFVFEDAIVGGVIPRQFIPSVEKGVRESMHAGIVGGHPVVDFKVRLVDGSHHSVDSSDNAFRIAGSMAFKKAMEEAGAVLLEPIMHMDVTVPDEVVGDVIGDLNSRRGRITGVVSRAGTQVVHAEAPMAEVLDYGNVLNAITSGRGLYTMRISTYQEVPSHIARKVLEAKQPKE